LFGKNILCTIEINDRKINVLRLLMFQKKDSFERSDTGDVRLRSIQIEIFEIRKFEPS